MVAFLEWQEAAVCPFPHMGGAYVLLLTSGGKDKIFFWEEIQTSSDSIFVPKSAVSVFN